MSKVVDERVVEMRFDNKQFESNVSQSMSTLQKLKQSLNLKGASKGLDDVNKAAKRVDMNPISRGVETVTAKFSALHVMGITALSNITNQAVNAGKRIVSALTIDPIKSGFKEYETQINAVQTILANTQKEGVDITRVNAALDELNAYADKTIYNFTEMTRNIGTFTAAGVDLDTSVNAIQGIANLAAISGSTSQQASTAMYQLSQALASGTVKLMDWNSVVNAGMGGQVFQDALKETARVHGIAIDQLIEDEGSFRETLSKGWLSSEILTETLQKFTLTTEGLTKEQIQANREMLKAKGYTEDQIDEIFKLGETATNAATKVKTFTQLWDVLKEAAQSGWAQTWRLIAGDFEEAKALFTPLSEFFTGIINKMSDARNKVLESALGKSFLLIGEKMQMLVRPATEAKKAIDDISGTVSNAIDTVTNLDEVVSKVIKGDFGNGQKRYDALTKAGYKWWEVQNKVNETLGSTKRHLADQTEAQEELNDAQEKTVETTGEVTSENEKLTEQQKERLKILAKMSDEELRSLGYTEWQIESFKKLRDTADELGLSIEELIDNADDLNGRWLIMDSFKNIGKSLLKIFTAIGEAWKKVFDPVDPENVFKGIGAFHKFTSQLVISDDTANKITSTFQGLFSILHLISTIAGGGLKLAFTIITKLLGSMGLGILDVTAFIGDAISKVHDFIFNNKLLNAAFNLLGQGILSAVEALKKLWNSFVNLPIVKDFISIIKGLPDTVSASFSEIVSAFDGGFVNGVTTIIKKFTEFAVRIKDTVIDKFSEFDFSELGKNIIDGLKNGLSDGGIISSVIEGIKTIGQSLINAFCELLGIHSPSTVFFNFGRNIVEGLINGIKWLITKAKDIIKSLGKAITEQFDIDFKSIKETIQDKLEIFWEKIKEFDFSKLLSLIPIATVMIFAKQLYSVVKTLSDVAKTLSDGIKGINEVIEGFASIEVEISKTIKAYRKNIQAKALRNIAISLLILVGCIAILTLLDTNKMYDALVVVTILAGILVGLAFAMDKLNSSSLSFKKGDGLNIDGLKNGLISIGVCILLLAAILKLIGSMKPEELIQGFVGLGAIILALASVIIIFGATAKIAGENASAINSAGKTFLQISIALLLITFAMKRIAKMSYEDLGKAIVFLLGFVGFIKLLTKATTIGNDKQIAKIGGLLIAISFALLLMVGVCKLIGLLTPGDMIKGVIFIGCYLLFIAGLTKVATLGKKSQHIAKLSGLLIAISFSLLLMVGVCKLVGMLTPEEMKKGGIFVAAFVGLIAVLMKILKIGSKDKVAKVAGTILAFSVAIGILALVSILMSMMSLEGLAKGLTAVVLLGLVMAAMVAATKDSKDCYKSIIVLVIAIAIMVAAVAVLSVLDPKALARSTAALVAMMLSFAAMEKCLPQKTAKKLLSSLIVLTVIVAILAGILVGMSLLGVNNAIKNTLALTTLMLAFAATMKIMSTCKSISKAALKGIYAMASIVIILAGILVGMAMLNVETSYSNIIGLSTLMLVFAATMKIMGTCKSISKAAIKGIYAMAGIVVILAGILAGLSLLNVETSLNNIAGLSTLMLAFAASMVIMGYAKAISKDAIPGIFAMVAVTALLALVLWELDALNVEASIETTASLSLLLIAFATATLILSKIGVGATAAVTGALAMAAVIGVVGIVITALGALVDKFPQLETFLDKGIPILEKIGYGIGSFIGSFVAGIAGGVLNILPALGAALSAFMVNATIFIAGCKLVDESVLEGIGILTLAILALCAADLIAGITSFLSFGPSFGDLAKQLSEFIINATPFIMGVRLLDKSALESAKTLVDLVMILSASKLIDAIASFLGSDISFGDFGEQLADFAEAVVDISSILTEGNINSEAITSLAEAGKAFATLQDSIEPMNGFVQKMTGSKDLGQFGAQIAIYAACLTAASTYLTNEDGSLAISPDAIQAAANAGTAMATLQGSIEPMSGFVQKMTGSKNLGQFGAQIAIYAGCLRAASTYLTNEDGSLAISPDAIQAAADAGAAMATLQDSIEPMGGFVQAMTGSKNLGQFGVQISLYAGCLRAASAVLTNEDGSLAISPDAIQAGVDAGAAMATLQDSIEPMGGFVQAMTGSKNLGKFGDQISLYASCLKDASSALSGESGSIAINSEAIDAAVAAGKGLVELQKTIPESTWLDGKVELDQFGTDVKKYGNGIAALGESVANVDGDKVSASINWGKRLVSLSNALDEFNQDGLEKFKKVKDIGVAISNYYAQVQSIDTTILSSSISSAIKLKNLIKGLVDIDTSVVDKFKVTSIGTAIKEYYDKVAGIDTTLLASSISSAIKLKNFIAGLVGIDVTGVDLFNPSILGARIRTYADKVIGIDLSGVNSSISAAYRIKAFISSLVGFDSSGVSLFSAAINELSSIKIGEFVSAFSAAAEQMPAVGLNFMNGLSTGIIQGSSNVMASITNVLLYITISVNNSSSVLNIAGVSLMNGMTQGIQVGSSALMSTMTAVINNAILSIKSKTSVFGSTGTLLINKLILGIKSKASLFNSTGSTLMSKLVSGIRSKASSISSAATSTLSSAVNAIRSYYNSFNNAGKFLGDGLIVGMNSKQAEAYNAGFALGKKSAEGVKAGAAVNSPSKLTIKTGEGLGEGLVVGMTNSMASVLKSSKDMGKRAAMSVASALNTVSNNADMSYEPTVRPVVDLSSFQYQADNLNIGAEISSRFLSGPVNSLQNIVTRAQTEINSSNAQVITAINDLRDDLNAYYSNDDNEISLYIDSRKVASTIAKPMNRELNILARRGAY